MLNVLLQIVAVTMAIYQLVYTQILIQGPEAHLITHLGFALAVVFLSLAQSQPERRYIHIVFLIFSLSAMAYLLSFLNELLLYRTALPALSDLVVGTVVITVVVAGVYFVYGKTFPLIAVASIAYLILGRYLPPPFSVAPIGPERLLMWLAVTLGTDEGIFGNILGISAYYLFLFIFFGAMLHAFGGTRFIISLGKWVGSKLIAGPAVIAVLGSSLLGTVTGSTVANITITGSFTIPLMKKAGYDPTQAGAIEAVSSNGGQLMPPIMGATAFVMAGFAGIPYVKIAMAALLPALLYYFNVFLYVQLTARKMCIRSEVESVQGKELLCDAPIFLLPLGVLIFLLVKGFTLPFVGFWSIVTLVGVGMISRLLRKDVRFSAKEIIEDLTKGVRSASEIALICALVGVVATAIKVSGLGIKLPLVIEELSHGFLPIALCIAMISSILLGMGVPTTAAYLLVAIGAVPALLAMGVPLLQAHFFCFIFAIFSHLTPPVAIGAMVAAQMADAEYWPTAWEAVKAGFTGLLLPFFVIYAPVVVLRPEGPFWQSVAEIGSVLLGVSAFQVALSGYLITYAKRIEKSLFMTGAVFCMASVISDLRVLLAVGALACLLGLLSQLYRTRKTRL